MPPQTRSRAGKRGPVGAFAGCSPIVAAATALDMTVRHEPITRTTFAGMALVSAGVLPALRGQHDARDEDAPPAGGAS